MFTPQKKVFSGWSITPRSDKQKTPATNANSSPRISDGYENGERESEDLGDAAEKASKLENELFEYQYNMGLLLIEKKEWSSRLEDLQLSLVEQESALKREQAAHLIAKSDFEKREENLKKALGVEKQCVLDLEKTLREMRSEYAEIKFTADLKLAEANALASSIEERSLEVEAKLHAADAKFAEASRKASEIERKLQDLEGREAALRRERLSFNSEKDSHDATLSKQREDLLEWERKLQEGEERLCESRRILNQREERVNEIDKGFKAKEIELEEAQKKMEETNVNLKNKEEDINQRLLNLTLKDKEFHATRKRIEEKEKELLAREEQLDEREKKELQKLFDEHKAQLDAKKQEFEVEMEQKRRSVDEELKSKVVELEKKEVEIKHMEEMINKREQTVDKKLEKCKEKENYLEIRSKTLKEKEKAIRAEQKSVEVERQQVLLEKGDLVKLSEELQEIKVANEEQLQKIQQQTEQLRLTEIERSEHSRLQEELKREIDSYRSQKEVLLKEAAELKQERMSFEREWEALDEKKVETEREIKRLTNEKEKWEKSRHLEEERLRAEILSSQKKLESDLEAFRLDKASFEAFMEQEKSLLSEREQLERAKLTDEFEQQKRDLEIEIQNQFEDKEKSLAERERLFEEEREREHTDINNLRKVAERGILDMKEEKRRIAKQVEEVSASKKELDERRIGIQQDIDELVVLSSKLKDQREQFLNERERFITFVESLKSCEHCGEITREFMLSDLQNLHDMERREILPLPKLAEDYIRNSPREALRPCDLKNDVIVRNVEAPTPAKSTSWLKKCTERILKLSPIKIAELTTTENTAGEASLPDQDASAGPASNRDEFVDEALDLSLRVVSDSLDVQWAQENESLRRCEGDQDHSVEGWVNDGKDPEDLKNTDFNGQPETGKRERARVSRTSSVKAVMKDAKDILGDAIELGDSECPNGDAEHPSDMDGTIREVSGVAEKENNRKGRKRGRAQASQTTASEQDEGDSEVHSESIVGGGPRRRRQKVAGGAQMPVEKRYNLRRPRIVGAAAAVKTSSDTRRGRKRGGAKESLERNSRLGPSDSAGVASDNGGSVNLMQAEIGEETNQYSTPKVHRMVESTVLSEEVNGAPDGHVEEYVDQGPMNGAPDRHVEEYVDEDPMNGSPKTSIQKDDDDEEEDDDEEVEHPGEASIGKKLWKFLTT